jgi:MazG family protein
VPKDAGGEFEHLVEVMTRLRGEQGCPWDREQTLASLRPYLIEEAYEVLDEMDRVVGGGPWEGLCEELGDLLFQVVFQGQLARERGEFDVADICRAVREKLIRRHPHVFGQLEVRDADEVLQNWVKLKAAERKAKLGHEGSVLDGVPSAAPALLRAERLTEKASRVGFDWSSIAEVRNKVSEEMNELDQAIASADQAAIEHELGDVLFALVNLARFTRTPAEDALRQANHRFSERFRFVEEGLRARGIAVGAATLEQMEELWQKAKERERIESDASPRPTERK